MTKVIASWSVVTTISSFLGPARSIKRSQVKDEINNAIVKETKTSCTSEGVSLFIDPSISHFLHSSSLDEHIFNISTDIFTDVSTAIVYFQFSPPCYFS